MIACWRIEGFDLYFGFGDLKTERELNEGFDLFQRNGSARAQESFYEAVEWEHLSGRINESGTQLPISVPIQPQRPERLAEPAILGVNLPRSGLLEPAGADGEKIAVFRKSCGSLSFDRAAAQGDVRGQVLS
jgi:hypothetical protein